MTGRERGRVRPEPPRTRAVELPDLAPAPVGDLAGDMVVVAASVAGLDLGGRALRGLTLDECSVESCRLDGTDLTRARLLNCRLDRVEATESGLARSSWWAAQLGNSRIGAAEAYDTELSGVRISGCRLGFLNLRNSTLTDVLVEDCVIDELDVGGAELERVAVRGTRIGSLVLRSARLRDTDLRGAEIGALDGLDSLAGATLTSAQVLDLAPQFAAHHRIDVRD